jgi:hypothetical protein
LFDFLTRCRANQALRDHIHVWTSLGILNPTPEARTASLAEFSEPTDVGQKRRADLRAAIAGTSKEFHGLGVEMNQRYPPNSPALFTADSEVANVSSTSRSNKAGHLTEDEIFTYVPNTNPGSRLPHLWLLPSPTPSEPVGKLISTIDVSGHGIFTLFTGLIGREKWAGAASAASKALNVEIKTVCVGWRQDYEDPYFTWQEVCEKEIGEEGAVLVRPDRFVGWRGRGGQETERLEKALRAILGK